MTRSSTVRASLLLALALVVPACGGGSSGGGAAPTGPAVVVTLTGGANTTESGGATTITVALATLPTQDVTIQYRSSDTSEGTVDGTGTLTFTSLNGTTAQTITVTGEDDALTDVATAYVIEIDPAVSTDTAYNGLDGADINLTNTDDEVVAITVALTTLGDVVEGGATQTFTVSLGSTPTANVSIPITVTTGATDVAVSGNGSGGQVATFNLVLTAANPSRVVTVHAIDDAVIGEAPEPYFITTGDPTSADVDYAALTALDVDDVTGGNALDNDSASIVVTPTTASGGLTVQTSELGTSDTFQVRLGSAITGTVTVTLTNVNANEGTTATPSGNGTTTLVFTAANATTFQTVTVTGIDDIVPDSADVEYTITLTSADTGGTDAAYALPVTANVVVTNIDTEGLTLPPGGVPGSTPTAAPGVPLGGAGAFNEFETTDPSVISNGASLNAFEMFFRGRSKAGTKTDAIGRAESPTLPESGWTNFSQVLSPDAGVNWIRRGVGRPSVIRADLDGDGGAVTADTYIMFYSGRFAGDYDGIDWVTSLNGQPGTWSAPAGAPRFAATGVAGDWDEDVVADPTVLLIGNTFHMWYTGVGGGLTQIGYATATLDTATGQPDATGFVRQNLLLVPALGIGAANRFDTGGVSQPAVVFDGATYKMWYTGNDPVRGRTTIGYAQSANPADFSAGRLPVPVIVPHATAVAAWADQNVFAPCALIKTAGTEYHVWYSGTGTGGMGVGYIEMQ